MLFWEFFFYENVLDFLFYFDVTNEYDDDDAETTKSVFNSINTETEII